MSYYLAYINIPHSNEDFLVKWLYSGNPNTKLVQYFNGQKDHLNTRQLDTLNTGQVFAIWSGI